MLPVSRPGTSASLTAHVSPLVLVTVLQPHAVDDDAATIAVTATASFERRRRQARAVERDAYNRPSESGFLTLARRRYRRVRVPPLDRRSKRAAASSDPRSNRGAHAPPQSSWISVAGSSVASGLIAALP